MGMTLQRPFDLTKATPDSGHWRWVSIPQAITVNGYGNFLDCGLIGGLGDVNGTAGSDTTCNVTDYTVPAGKAPFLDVPVFGVYHMARSAIHSYRGQARSNDKAS